MKEMTQYKLMDLLQQIRTLEGASQNRYIQSENPSNLTDAQAIVLDYILVESRTRDVFSKDLEKYFGIKPSSVSSMVDYLEKNGYVERQILKEDKRLKKLVPTKKALDISDWLLSTFDSYILDAFVGFTEEEMQTLKTLMEKMRLNLASMAARREPHFPRTPEAGNA